jgi:hypothetical protein
LLEFRTPPIDFKCFSKVDADTTKFIGERLLLQNYAKASQSGLLTRLVLNYFLTELSGRKYEELMQSLPKT